MARFNYAISLILLSLIVFAAPLFAETKDEPPGPPGSQSGWTSFVRGGGVYQFDTDLDEGGSYDAKRFTIQAGQGYRWNYRTSASLALGYSYDGYSFSNKNNTAAFAPWEDIHSLSLSLPMRYGIDKDWSTFFIPSVRSSGESGANFDETITGGVLAGFAYRFGDKLTLGPGIGFFSQLEESVTVIPILIINWNITETISLETGRGLGATLGPGLTLNYHPNKVWNFAIGGRYEKLRFRLDKDGPIPSGVGEDQSFPLFASCTYSLSPKTQISLVGGVELGGELIVEDDDGRSVKEESSDPGGFLGLTFNIRF